MTGKNWIQWRMNKTSTIWRGRVGYFLPCSMRVVRITISFRTLLESVNLILLSAYSIVLAFVGVSTLVFCFVKYSDIAS